MARTLALLILLLAAPAPAQHQGYFDGLERAHIPLLIDDRATDPAAEAINATLERMEAAVLAGDPQRYLAHVADTDPVFRTEQANWAADLAEHTPADFDLDIDDVESRGAWVEADLTMTWTMPGATERSVRFRAGFERAGGQWKYAGEVWHQVPAKGAVALCDPGLEEVGQTAVNVYPEVRAHVEEGFGITLDAVQQIKIYASMRHLQASIYLSYTDGLAGWNEPGESIKILARRRPSRPMLQALLAHELGHVATFAMGQHATDMPWWALEGVAELASERYAGSAEMADSLARRWAAAGTLAPWDEIADFRKTPPKWMMHVYKQSQAFIGYISERFGREPRNAWIAAMARGATLDEATRDTFGIGFDQLDEQWRATLTGDS